MIVISDTTTINYLVLIDAIRVLPALYGTVSIPSAVLSELSARAAPTAVGKWVSTPPEWLEIKPPSRSSVQLDSRLGAGEHQAIQLAILHEDSLLLLDDLRARREAARLELRAVGTLAVLRAAHDAGLFPIEEAIRRLQATSFQASAALYDHVLRSSSGRRQ